MESYKSLRLECEDDIGVLTLNNPPRNTLPSEAGDQFIDIAARIRKSAIRVVVITGTGPYFCAGADPSDLDPDYTASEMRELAARAQRNLRALVHTGRPLIAAINGLCMGLGLELALTCHLRVASERARLGAPEVCIGFFPCAGGTQLLPRVVGPARAYELVLTGDSIRAADALQWGLVNRVVKPDQCLPTAMSLARRIATKSALGVASALEAIERGLDLPLGEGLRVESGLMATLGESADRQEGFRAYAEDRVPAYRESPPAYVNHSRT